VCIVLFATIYEILYSAIKTDDFKSEIRESFGSDNSNNVGAEILNEAEIVRLITSNTQEGKLI
jgi:hypothetical protein